LSAGASIGAPSLADSLSSSAEASNSLSSLLQHDETKKDKAARSKSPLRSTNAPQNDYPAKTPPTSPDAAKEMTNQKRDTKVAKKVRTSGGLVRFNIPGEDGVGHKDKDMKLRLAELSRRRSLRRDRRKVRDGEIIKMEKMLVRVESTLYQVPDGYDENESMKITTRTVEKWREFVVVCRERESEEASLSLQFYKSRVSTHADSLSLMLTKVEYPGNRAHKRQKPLFSRNCPQ
jgi:hypothetical protein